MGTFLGISRERVFSPGRVRDDAAILEAVAICLRQGGHKVTVVSADDEDWPRPSIRTVVFTMCQGEAALAQLQRWHASGVHIINSPAAILNCRRQRTLALCAESGVTIPESVLIETGAAPAWPAWLDVDGAWLKRADVHATEADDVVRVAGAPAANQSLQQMRQRGIQRAVLQRHVAGTVYKFYAVRDRFFHCVPPAPGTVIDAAVLEAIEDVGRRAALALGVDVYGGDCVSADNGFFCLIDLNDWPSYARCRGEAAYHIAAHLHARSTTTNE